MPSPSATRATPISRMKASASIFTVGCRAMKPLTGLAAASMMRMAMTLARIITIRMSVMPTAVMIEFEREDEVDHHDQGDDADEIGAEGLLRAFLAAFHILVNFHGALVEQEEAAEDQDDVAPGQVEAGDGDDRIGELGQPHQHGQHDDAQDERAR